MVSKLQPADKECSAIYRQYCPLIYCAAFNLRGEDAVLLRVARIVLKLVNAFFLIQLYIFDLICLAILIKMQKFVNLIYFLFIFILFIFFDNITLCSIADVGKAFFLKVETDERKEFIMKMNIARLPDKEWR